MPDRPQLMVVNATPIISLALIDQLDLLRMLYGRILRGIFPPIGSVSRWRVD